jgi:hypothetical protein
MPTHRRFFLWAGMTAMLLGAPAARAETPPRIDRVRIGLPAGKSGQESGRSRNGAWAPVAVTLKSGTEGNPQGVYRIRIETKDLEDLTYQFTVGVPALAGTSERTVLGYAVPAGEGAEFRVLLEKGGRILQSLKVSRDTSKDEVLAATDILFLAAGAGLSQLKRAAEKLDRPEGKEAEVDPEAGRRQFVFADEVSLLPDRWFGYDAVDVVVLATGKRDFVNQLAQDSESPRRNALLEWVRRGGQLVLSVGRNKQEVAQLFSKMALLDCKVTGSEVVNRLTNLSNWCELAGNRQPLQQVEVATLVPGKSVHVMLRERRDGGRPLLLESSCGLGRVILVAFDLDTPPFATWDGQLAFWTRLQAEVAPYLPVRAAGQGKKGGPAVAPAGPAGGLGIPGMDEAATYDFRADLKRRLEAIDQVPVIPFYWVALFIFFYIALVGPLDYFVLKKLFKRLELTWITFPLTVLVVSVIAYAIAYASKGDEVRVKKVDLIDVDLHAPQQVYGHTWFTLFSPRAQSYTVGIEPADTWTGPVPPSAPGPVLTLLEGGDRSPRAGSAGLFPRPYEYADEAQGLLRVPVPVWATRSFTASWRAPVQPKQPPIGIDDEVGPIRRARDGEGLVGRLTNNLPTELRSVALFYKEKWYSLGSLAPGESRRVEQVFARDAQGQNRQIAQWLHVSDQYNPQDLLAPGMPLAPTGRPIPENAEARSTFAVIKPLLFFGAYRSVEDTTRTNAGLRSLDQTWRLRHLPEYPAPERPRFRAEAILVARTPMLVDRAEAVTAHGASPSHLWLGELPAPGVGRPDLPGYITQETYLRVFIPVSSDR